MNKVIKKNGNREKFDSEKLKKSIEKAAIDANKKIERKSLENVWSGVIRNFESEKNDFESSAIRSKVLKALGKEERSVANAWRRFDKKYKSLN